MTEEDAEEAEKLCMELAKERTQPDAECTEDEVEQQAAWCQKGMSSVLDDRQRKLGSVPAQ